MMNNWYFRKTGALAALGFTLVLGSTTPAFSQALSAHTFSNQQLLEAGWTEAQIAGMRAQAPTPHVGARPEPEKKHSAVIGYTSVFDDYVPFDYLPDIGWREANDRVGKIGGWRNYAKLVQEAQKKEAMDNKVENSK